jgi:hypothetical protein
MIFTPFVADILVVVTTFKGFGVTSKELVMRAGSSVSNEIIAFDIKGSPLVSSTFWDK